MRDRARYMGKTHWNGRSRVKNEANVIYCLTIFLSLTFTSSESLSVLSMYSHIVRPGQSYPGRLVSDLVKYDSVIYGGRAHFMYQGPLKFESGRT